MDNISKEYLQTELDKDWILRALIIDHSIYWRGKRATIENIESLKKFLAAHSIAHTKAEINGFLSIYAARGFFTNPQTPSPDTGLIHPDTQQIISDFVHEKYNLDRLIQAGYSVADFLWDAYGHKHGVEQKLAHNFETLFKEISGFETTLFVVNQNSAEEHDYLRLTWKDANNKNYAWWIGFLPGGFLKRDDAVAEGLTTKMAFKLKTLSSTGQYFKQFWTICAVDVSQHAISTAREINDTFNLGASFNFALVLSLIRLIAWADGIGKPKLSNLTKFFSHFFENQDYPISTSKGVSQVEKAAKEAAKNS